MKPASQNAVPFSLGENSMNRASKRQNKKSAASVQALIGIKAFTDYGLLTNSGELLFYLVTPTNLSVLSSSSIESKIRQLTLALSAIPELEIACTDSAECLDGNKSYLSERMNAEANGKVKSLLKQDIGFLDEIQLELSTARQFLFVFRCRGLNPSQVFAQANNIQKILSEQGFDGRRMKKEEIKRMIALYFDASLFGEQIPDVDGEQYFDLKENGETIS